MILTSTNIQSMDFIKVYASIGSSFEIDESLLMQYLTKNERDRAEKFICVKDKKIFRHAHAFMNLALCLNMNIPLKNLETTNNKFGKPLLKDGKLFFNLSHSQNFWCLAIDTSSDVGIDMEEIKEDFAYKEIIKGYFSPAEIQIISNATNPTHHFFKLWTRKEAVVKAEGIGLNCDLSKIEVHENINYTYCKTFQKLYFITTFKIKDTYLSIASQTKKKINLEIINSQSSFLSPTV